MKIANAHMPFVAPDADGRPVRFCCRRIEGVWKLHCFDGADWVRLATGFADDVTECAPTAEFSDGEWRISFIAGSSDGQRENRLYRMRGFDGVPEAVTIADVGYCRERWTVSGTRRGPLLIDNDATRRTLAIGGMEFYYRVSFDPSAPLRLLISAQRFDRQIVSMEYDLHSGQLFQLVTVGGRPLYKVALWENSAFYGLQDGPGFEDRALEEAGPGEWRREELPASLVELVRLDPATMNCLLCLRKHLAAALSYGKEVLQGHGADAVMPHCADFAGELANAEHHAAQMEGVTYAQHLRELRHKLDEQAWTPSGADLDLLRRIWQSSMGISACSCRKR